MWARQIWASTCQVLLAPSLVRGVISLQAGWSAGRACPPRTKATLLSDWTCRKGLFWKDVEDTVMCAACAPPGGGRQEVTAR